MIKDKQIERLIYGSLFLIILILAFTSAWNIIVAPPSSLQWFGMRIGEYDDGREYIGFDFYLKEGLDPNLYLGTLNLVKEGNIWYVDEFVDHTPQGGYTIEDIDSMILDFSQSILLILNQGALFDSAWSGGIPQDFGGHNTYRSVLEEKVNE